MNAITNAEEFAEEVAQLVDGLPEDQAAALLRAIAEGLRELARVEQLSEPAAGSTH
jgi:DNA-directed RNA polymerase specialized sigma24 family protein